MNTFISNCPAHNNNWYSSNVVVQMYQWHVKQKIFFLSFVTSYFCLVSASTALSKNARANIFGVRFPVDCSQLDTIITTRGGSRYTTGGNTSNAIDRYTSTEEQVLSPPPPPTTSWHSIHQTSMPLKTNGNFSTFIPKTESASSNSESSSQGGFPHTTIPLPPPSEEYSTSFIQTNNTVVAGGPYMVEKERQKPVTYNNMQPPPPPPPPPLHQSSNNLVPMNNDGNINDSSDDLWTSPSPPTQLSRMVEEADEITISHDPDYNISSVVVENDDASTWEVSCSSGFPLWRIVNKDFILRPTINAFDDMINIAVKPHAHHQIITHGGVVTDQDSQSIGIVTSLKMSLSTIESQLRQQWQQQKKMMNVWLYLLSLSMMYFQRQRRQEQLEGQFLTKLVLFLLVLYPPRQERLFDKSMVDRDLTDDEFDSLIERIENCDRTSHDILLDYYLDKNQPTMAKVNQTEKSFTVVRDVDARRQKEEETTRNTIILDHNVLEESDEESNFLTEEEQRILDESCI